MTIAYFGNTLNPHQAYVADALFELTGGNYIYVETVPPVQDNKSGGKLQMQRQYILRAYESADAQKEAHRISREVDVALFGAYSLEYEVERMRTTGRLAFEVSERWLKRGWMNILSPRLLKNMWYYHTLFHNKPLYKLCSSAYGAGDQYRLHSFKDRCYKWGYFTKVDSNFEVEAPNQVTSTSEITPIMWCARFLKLKHPELPVQLAARLKERGYIFVLDMFGSGDELERTKALIKELGVEDCVNLRGSLPNEEILKEMRKHSIFLFTSDRNEGWGAVLNEAMSNGCTVVASDAIGSVPFLVEDKTNGLIFKSENIDSLYEKVMYLIEHPMERKQMAISAYKTMRDVWSPAQAAQNLLQLIEDLKAGNNSNIMEGPCSKAQPI